MRAMRQLLLLAAALLLLGSHDVLAHSRDMVRATGSSTVAPFPRAVAASLAEGRQGAAAEIWDGISVKDSSL